MNVMMLGKRKRETAVLRRTPDDSQDLPSEVPLDSTTIDVFRKHFEANFNPLPESRVVTSTPREHEDNIDGDEELDIDIETDSDWSGISEHTTSEPTVQVVDYAITTVTVNDDPIEKIFQKSFMGHRPPKADQADQTSNQSSTIKATADNDLEENVNLKHDLDLQRLLRESHLLEQTRKKPDGGAQRHKATESRLRSLGSKVSLFTQEKMPMSHRRGILGKTSSKEAHRRKEARENGIILEKPSKKTSTPGSRRERGVDLPVVGKFKSGTLHLSRKDVASIQGPRRSGSKRGRRG